MTAIRHTSNAGRARARLISTPTERHDMSTTVAGVKFSDTLAALLDHAIAHGFRVEEDTRGKSNKANAVVVYPPDKTLSPISVSERGARFNKAHYENVRRELYHAGCPPLPADAPRQIPGLITANSAAEALAQLPEGTHVVELGALTQDGPLPSEIEALLDDPEEAPKFIATVVESLVSRAGVGAAEADLLGLLTFATMSWSQKFSPDRINEAAAKAVSVAEAGFKKDIDEALALAAGFEKQAAASDRDAERALAREQKARDDCAAALRRAETAEAEARRLEAAIAPLRAVLGGS
jgi:hypothetical protein